MRVQARKKKIRGIKKIEEAKWKILDSTLIVALD